MKALIACLIALAFGVGTAMAVTLSSPQVDSDVAQIQSALDSAQTALNQLKSDLGTTTTDATTTSETTTTTSSEDTVNLMDESWKCEGPVDLKSVTVTITANASATDAVLLRKGCTGHIGMINVVNYKGDGIKVNAAKDLTIDHVVVRCYAHSDGKHQDGIQVMGGETVRIHDADVGCYSANNSQVWINDGTGDNTAPVDVVFEGGHFQGYFNGGQYGPGGSYGVAILNSTASGFRNATICPNAHPAREFVVGDSAIQPVNDSNTVLSSC